MTQDDTPDEHFYMHIPEFTARSRKVRATYADVVALDMIAILGGGKLMPFDPDPDRAAAAMAAVTPNRSKTADELRAMRDDLLLFFVELPDGRWVPSPEVFSVIDGNPGSES